MDIWRIIGELIEERNRLTKIIEAVEGFSEQAPPPKPKGRRGRRSMDEQARQEVSERMTRYWAKRRAERRAEPASDEEETTS